MGRLVRTLLKHRAFSASIFALRLAAALAALAIMLVPGETWSRPALDLDETGFDSETMPVGNPVTSFGASPFTVLVNGQWTPCPCSPGQQLSLVGRDLIPFSLADPEGPRNLGGVTVTVNDAPARVYVVSPAQVNILLDEAVAPPGASIAIQRDGRETAREFVAVKAIEEVAPPNGAGITMTPEQLLLRSEPGASSIVHLITTPRSFNASLDVLLEESKSVAPFQFMLWNTRNQAAVGLSFGPPPERSVDAIITDPKRGIVHRQRMTALAPSETARISVEFTREEYAEFAITGEDGTEHRVGFGPQQASAFFEAYRPTLSVLSKADHERVSVSLTDFHLEMPHERFISVRIDDPKATIVSVIVLSLAAILYAVPAWRFAGRVLAAIRPTRIRLPQASRWLLPAGIATAALLGFVGPLGSHPFDMASQTTWTYLLTDNGIGDIYYRAQTVPLAEIWRGVPYHEAVYPYGPSMAYYFMAIGETFALAGGDTSTSSASLEVAIKGANAVVALADACLIYLLARGYGRRTLAWIAPIAFLFNPAMLFDVFVWGETESVALFFLLASLLAAQRGAAIAAWALLAMCFLGKPTVIVPAVAVAVYYLRLFPLRHTLDGVSVAAPLALAVVFPFVLNGYSPSIAIDPILGAFSVFGGDESEAVFKTVSYDSYSVWPIVTMLRHDVHGLARLQYPDSFEAVGSFTYQQIGVLGFGIAFLAVLVWLLFTRRTAREPGLIFLVLMFVMMAELIIPTRSIARYLVFPVVFGIVGASSDPRSRTVWLCAAAITFTSVVGMYGSVASGLESNPDLGPSLAPENNAITDFALRMFHSDTVITIGSLLNTGALLTLGWNIWLKGARVPAVSLGAMKPPLPAAQTGGSS